MIDYRKYIVYLSKDWATKPGEELTEIVSCKDCKYHEYMTVSYLDKSLSVCYSEQW